MQESLEDSGTFKRRFKRTLIVLAIIEFIVTASAVLYETQK